MIASTTMKCENCDTVLVVVPPTIGQFKSPTEEPGRVGLPSVPEGAHLVTADEQGRFACPNCGADNVASELRLE